MSEDTDWLKKNPIGNPFRMSLRRSSRFYAQDMDGSIMNNEAKSSDQVLVVSHVPRRSKMPIERIKEMNFKFPAPVAKKTGIKKPITRVSKFSVGGTMARPSTCFRPEQNKNVEGPSLKMKPRPSGICRPSQPSSYLMNGSVYKGKITQKLTGIPERGSNCKSSADVSFLSQSKIVNQSTPKEPGAIRSILKQEVNSHIPNSLSKSKKKNVAKRVNFNSDSKKDGEKQNEESAVLANESFAFAGGSPAKSSEAGKNLLVDNDEETTVSFFKSFKEIECEDNENGASAKAVDVRRGKQSPDEKQERKEGEEENKIDLSDSSNVHNIMDVWKLYQCKVNDIRSQLRSVEQSFQNNLKFVMDDSVKDEFSAYETEKGRLYGKLKCLEQELSENMRNNINVKTIFLNYLEKKENIFKKQSELEDDFGKKLGTILEVHVRRKGTTVGSGKEPEADEEGSAEKRESVDGDLMPVKRTSLGKGRPGSSSGSRVKSIPRKRSSREMAASNGDCTPDNTPARRRKLSRKIEKQIKALFDDERTDD